MISITTSIEQKKRLIEMIDSLFPKDKFQTGNLRFYSNETNAQTWTIYFNEEKQQVHWFEFCMTYMVEKLIICHDSAQKNIDATHDFLRKCHVWWAAKFIRGEDWDGDDADCDHPIDMLYKIFKQIGTEKKQQSTKIETRLTF